MTTPRLVDDPKELLPVGACGEVGKRHWLALRAVLDAEIRKATTPPKPPQGRVGRLGDEQ